MSGGIGHGDKAAVRVTQQSKFREAERLADGVEVGDLGVHCLRSSSLHTLRRAGASLVIQDDETISPDALPEVVLHHVGMRESRAAVDGDDRERGSFCSKSFVTEIDLLAVSDAGSVGDGLCREWG